MQVIIADDHKLVRDGISPFILQLADDVEILEAASLSEVMTQIDQASNLGLVILDLIMPGMNSFNGVSEVSSRCPDVPVVVLSGYASRDHVISAMKHGASGFIPKTVAATTMLSALRLVLSGEKYLPCSSFQATANAAPAQPPINASDLMAKLTDRERDVIGLTMRGLTNKVIAAALNVKEITIKVHLRNIYRKIGVRNRAQAINLAMASGFDAGSRLV